MHMALYKSFGFYSERYENVLEDLGRQVTWSKSTKKSQL